MTHNAAPHLKPIIATAYFTVMREGKILNLKCDKVDLKERIIRLEAEDTKDNEPRLISICNELFEYQAKLPRGIGSRHVFLHKVLPMKYFRTSLKKACKKAGIVYGKFEKDGFVFHDMRHTFNTNMRKAGIAESVMMQITGHSTRTMFDRYNAVDREDIKQAVDQMQGLLENVTQSVRRVD